MGNCGANDTDGVQTTMTPGQSRLKQSSASDGSNILKIYKAMPKPSKLLPAYSKSYQTIQKYFDSKGPKQLSELGQAYQAIKFYNHAIKSYRSFLEKKGNTQNRREIEINLAECLMEIGKVNQALQIFNRVLETQSQDYLIGIKLLKNKGICQCSAGMINQAIETYSKVSRMSEQYDMTKVADYPIVLSRLAEIYISEGKIIQAVETIKSALKSIDQLPQSLEKAEAMMELAEVCQTFGVRDKAESLLNQSESLIINLAGKDSTSYVNLLFYKASFFNEFNRYLQSQGTLVECEAQITALFGQYSIQYCEITMYQGILSLSKANNTEAITLFNKSFQLFVALNEQINETCPFILIEMVIAYSKIGSTKKGQEACNRAFKLIEEIYDLDSIQSAEIGTKFVMVLFENNFIEAAINGCKQILRIYDMANLKTNGNYYRTAINLGEIFFAIGQLGKAQSQIRTVFSALEQLQEPNQLYSEACFILSQIYIQKRDQQKAALYKQKSDSTDLKINSLIEELQKFTLTKNTK